MMAHTPRSQFWQSQYYIDPTLTEQPHRHTYNWDPDHDCLRLGVRYDHVSLFSLAINTLNLEIYHVVQPCDLLFLQQYTRPVEIGLRENN